MIKILMEKQLNNIQKYLCVLFMVVIPGMSFAAENELITVPYVDVQKYMGTWYEISSFPQRFQKGCTASKATYTMREDEDIDVLNECRLNTIDGKLKQARAKAWVINKNTNAKLKVRFFWPFTGKYWIIDLGEKYDYAVVGHPNRKYLWILSRTPKMSDELYNSILTRIQKKGYDLSPLQKTTQP
jgi:apolipoprotein D and lipocalin family protein